jgi:hypothetical protein
MIAQSRRIDCYPECQSNHYCNSPEDGVHERLAPDGDHPERSDATGESTGREAARLSGIYQRQVRAPAEAKATAMKQPLQGTTAGNQLDDQHHDSDHEYKVNQATRDVKTEA